MDSDPSLQLLCTVCVSRSVCALVSVPVFLNALMVPLLAVVNDNASYTILRARHLPRGRQSLRDTLCVFIASISHNSLTAMSILLGVYKRGKRGSEVK